MEQTITIEGQENKQARTGNMKYILISDGKKYEFFRNKADGTASVAYTEYDRLKPQLGDSLIVNVEETPESFQDSKTGKTVNYTKRRIMKFMGKVGENTPTGYTPTSGGSENVPQRDLEALEARVAVLEKRMSESPLWIIDKGRWTLVPPTFD